MEIPARGRAMHRRIAEATRSVMAAPVATPAASESVQGHRLDRIVVLLLDLLHPRREHEERAVVDSLGLQREGLIHDLPIGGGEDESSRDHSGSHRDEATDDARNELDHRHVGGQKDVCPLLLVYEGRSNEVFFSLRHRSLDS